MYGLTPRRLWPFAMVGALLTAVAVAASVATPGIHSVPLPREWESAAAAAHQSAEVRAGISQPPVQHAQHPLQPPHWLIALLSGLCGAISLLIVGFLVWRLIRFTLEQRVAQVAAALPTGAAMSNRRDQVLAAVDASIAELASDDGDARSAVIACWVRLEDVAALAGTEREPGDTPSDLVARLLSAHQVSAKVLRELADLYLAARYGTREIESDMRRTARSALGQLRTELSRSRSGPLEHIPVAELVTSLGPRPAVPPSGFGPADGGGA